MRGTRAASSGAASPSISPVPIFGIDRSASVPDLLVLNECPECNALSRELVLAPKPSVETVTPNPKPQNLLGESWFLFLLALAWRPP
jgi:hypothetical protein